MAKTRTQEVEQARPMAAAGVAPRPMTKDERIAAIMRLVMEETRGIGAAEAIANTSREDLRAAQAELDKAQAAQAVANTKVQLARHEYAMCTEAIAGHQSRISKLTSDLEQLKGSK